MREARERDQHTPGATILGGGTMIGEGAVIGGNIWVIESVPPGEKVLFTRTSRAKQKEILERAYGFWEEREKYF